MELEIFDLTHITHEMIDRGMRVVMTKRTPEVILGDGIAQLLDECVNTPINPEILARIAKLKPGEGVLELLRVIEGRLVGLFMLGLTLGGMGVMIDRRTEETNEELN